MQRLGLSGYALTIGVASALLAGCGGSQLAGPVIPGASSASRAASGSQTFHYTGAEQIFTVPRGVTSITVVARGGAGAGSLAGRGGRVYAVLPAKPGENLAVFVGGAASGADGGFNGGGNGATISGSFSAGGGGGASDLRRGGQRLRDRILVSAGGGGEGESYPSSSGSYFSPGTGGSGGGNAGGSGTNGGGGGGSGGAGGTQSKGGDGGVGGSSIYHHDRGHRGKRGVIGTGGVGGAGVSSGGGGGGGYFGGGGGGGGGFWPSQPQPAGGGGGGGSSYVESNAIKYRTWSGWKGATGDGLIVISWN